jgi:tRNA-specific adenosine deaminase 3
MNETAQSRAIHTGKSNWIYIILGGEIDISQNIGEDEVVKAMAAIEGMEEQVFLRAIPVPKHPPTSQVQAAMWSQNFWPTVYRKNNPLGPHPAMIARNTEDIVDDASIWMTLAHQVANEGKDCGYGEPMGACIVQREEGKVTIVALAADARWHNQPCSKVGDCGNPMAHAVMRAISMVAQKLVRAENRVTDAAMPPILEFEAFQDGPILDDEKKVFEQEHPSPDGYLCHGLELYLTHEPCVMCSMAILHSRMGKVVFRHRMPLTGGLCAEDRDSKHPVLNGLDGGKGLGLFWRRELNWSLVAWEWESGGCAKPLLVDHAIHA